MAPDFLIRCLTVSALETADDGTSQHSAHLFPCISLFSKRQRKKYSYSGSYVTNPLSTSPASYKKYWCEEILLHTVLSEHNNRQYKRLSMLALAIITKLLLSSMDCYFFCCMHLYLIILKFMFRLSPSHGNNSIVNYIKLLLLIMMMY